MKYQQILLTVLVVFFLASGFVTMSFHDRNILFYNDQTTEVEILYNSFLNIYKPILLLDLNSMYGRSGNFSVLHPLLKLQSQLAIKNKDRCLDSASGAKSSLVPITASQCNARNRPHEKNSPEFFPDQSLTQAKMKTKVLRESQEKGRSLPKSFLTEPPFVDEEGQSYAFGLINMEVKPFIEKNWIEEHLSYFTLKELKTVIAKYEITALPYETLSRLTEDEVGELVKGAPLVLSREHLFVRDQPRFGFSPLRFFVYRVSDLREFFRANSTKYTLEQYSQDQVCVLKAGNACWSYSANHFFNYLFKYSLATLISLGAILLLIVFSYVRRIRGERREQVMKRVSLQVLSHEFRTPVASLILNTDELTNRFEKFDVDTQDLIARIATDAFRLQRIIEVSKTFLQAEGGHIQFRFTKVPSVNEWLADFVGEIADAVDTPVFVRWLNQDQAFFADPFWLKFMLTNLIQNAFAHGNPPVWIRLETYRGNLRIKVEDQGRCEFDSIETMADPFIKSRRSRGMGLGLNIVKYVSGEWGSKLIFSMNPTTFTLEIPTRIKGSWGVF
jgi:hypothetical protein